MKNVILEFVHWIFIKYIPLPVAIIDSSIPYSFENEETELRETFKVQFRLILQNRKYKLRS